MLSTVTLVPLFVAAALPSHVATLACRFTGARIATRAQHWRAPTHAIEPHPR